LSQEIKVFTRAKSRLQGKEVGEQEDD
jgi:hypothetical protein